MRILAFALALPLLFVAGVSKAEMFTGCLNNKDKIVRLAIGPEPARPCGNNSQEISWNSDGPPGEPGAQGEPGEQGPPGPDTLADLVCEADDVAVFDGVQWVCESDLPALPRFVDNGDGTVTDNGTGLMWEKKEVCGGVNLSNPHCVENEYTWSSTGAQPDGTLYTDFLRRINLGESLSFAGTTITRAGYTDWRVPNIVELRNILVEPYLCSVSPCIDATFGPTEAERHWSSSSGTITGPLAAFNVSFFDGFVNGGGVNKTSVSHVRAVRSIR